MPRHFVTYLAITLLVVVYAGIVWIRIKADQYNFLGDMKRPPRCTSTSWGNSSIS